MTANKNPIHVLHVVSGDLWAGAEAMLFALAKSLQDDLNLNVSVIILNPGILEKKLREIGIHVTVIDEAKYNGFKIIKRLNTTISEIKPNIIHSHRLKENIMASIVAWRYKIPSLRTQHGSQEHHYRFWQLPNLVIQNADWFCGRFLQGAVVAVSQPLANELESSFPEKKIQIIENGLDIKSLASTKDTANTEVKPENHPHYRVGIIGRLTPVKRVDLFIQMAVLIKQKPSNLNVNFHIYGDGPLRKELESLVRANNAEEYIHFEGHCNNIPERLKTLDALLMPSDHEGLPMILLEAMYLQTPIIAHAIGGIPYLLNHGECGVLIKQHTASAFAQALEQLINQPDIRKRLTQQAHQRVLQHYSSTQTATKYLSVYHSLIKQ